MPILNSLKKMVVFKMLVQSTIDIFKFVFPDFDIVVCETLEVYLFNYYFILKALY